MISVEMCWEWDGNDTKKVVSLVNVVTCGFRLHGTTSTLPSRFVFSSKIHHTADRVGLISKLPSLMFLPLTICHCSRGNRPPLPFITELLFKHGTVIREQWHKMFQRVKDPYREQEFSLLANRMHVHQISTKLQVGFLKLCLEVLEKSNIL